MLTSCKLFNYVKLVLCNNTLGKFKGITLQDLIQRFLLGLITNIGLIIIKEFQIKLYVIMICLIMHLGYIKALLFMSEILGLVLKYIIYIFSFILCVVWWIAYLYSDPTFFFIYTDPYISTLFIIIFSSILFFYLSVIFLQNALKAYIKKDDLSFVLNIILSLVCYLIGIILIVYAFKLYKVFYQGQGSPVETGSSANPSNNSGPGDNGNGNGNSNPNHSGLAGSSQTDEERRKYNEKKLNYLKSQEALYIKVIQKARLNSKNLRKLNPKSKDFNKLSVETNLARNKAIKEASQARLFIVQKWLDSHINQKEHFLLRKRKYYINHSSLYKLQLVVAGAPNKK